MRILGIDPGLAIVGWGIVDYEKSKFHTVAYGALRTPAGVCTEERLGQIYEGMQALLEKYHPDAVAIATERLKDLRAEVVNSNFKDM